MSRTSRKPWTSSKALNPLTPGEAWGHVERRQAAPAAWTPRPGRGHSVILKDLIVRLDLRAGLMSDAILAAMCIEHGLDIVSADSDFARLREITWINPPK